MIHRCATDSLEYSAMMENRKVDTVEEVNRIRTNVPFLQTQNKAPILAAHDSSILSTAQEGRTQIRQVVHEWYRSARRASTSRRDAKEAIFPGSHREVVVEQDYSIDLA